MQLLQGMQQVMVLRAGMLGATTATRCCISTMRATPMLSSGLSRWLNC